MPNWPASNNLNGVLQQVAGALAAVPAGKVRYLLLVVTGVWFLSLLADVFWMAFPAPVTAAAGQPGGSVLPSAPINQPRQNVDITFMQSWYLFGSGIAGDSAGAEQAEGQPEAPDDATLTSLQLVLLGALQSDIPEESYAIIQTPQKAELIKVGDNIPVGDGVVLAKVLVDRVIINNRGRMESLLLYAESRQPSAEPVPVTEGGKKVLDQRNNPELSMMANNYRNQLMTNPMSLTDVIKISIAKDPQGQIMGYRVRPGRDRTQFAQFGLQTGDIVTAINGVALDDPAKAMELYGQLREAREASFVVKRGNEEINLIVGLGQ